MNRLFGIIIILIVVAAGLTILFWSMRPRVSTATNESAEPESYKSPKPQVDQSNTLVSSSPTADHTRESHLQHADGVYEPGDLRWTWWNEMRKKDPEFEWKMPINFYGKVVDENDQPVVGAIITLRWTDLSPDGSSSEDILSDSSGRFSLTGKQGKRLVIDNIEKDGYHLSKTQNDFSYVYAAFFEDIFHEAEPDKPVMFRMIRRGIIEPLIYRDTLYLLKPDGTAHYLDFTNRSEEGRRTILRRFEVPIDSNGLQQSRTPELVINDLEGVAALVA